MPIEQDLIYNFEHRKYGTEKYKLPVSQLLDFCTHIVLTFSARNNLELEEIRGKDHGWIEWYVQNQSCFLNPNFTLLMH